MPDPSLDSMARLAEDVVVRMFVATDERDWSGLANCFTDPLVLDMTSMTGGTPATLSPRQVAESWAEGFKSLDSVHHQVGNFRTVVNGPEALVKCYGIALHHRKAAQGPKTRLFVGTYDLHLTLSAGHWRIAQLVFHLKFIDGNPELEK